MFFQSFAINLIKKESLVLLSYIIVLSYFSAKNNSYSFHIFFLKKNVCVYIQEYLLLS